MKKQKVVKPKKEKIKPSDGLGAYEIKKLRSATRQCWQRSKARKIAVDRCTREDGFTYCEVETCLKITPKIKIDHTIAVGDLDDGYIPRLFCPSSGLVGMCSDCHKVKTKEERKLLKVKE